MQEKEQFMKEFNELRANNPHLEYIEIIGEYKNEKSKIKAKCHYCNYRCLPCIWKWYGTYTMVYL